MAWNAMVSQGTEGGVGDFEQVAYIDGTHSDTVDRPVEHGAWA